MTLWAPQIIIKLFYSILINEIHLLFTKKTRKKKPLMGLLLEENKVHLNDSKGFFLIL